VRVETELDNLRVAVAWSLESEDAEAALNIISALALQGLRIEASASSWAAMAVSSVEAARHGHFPVSLAVLGWWRLNEGRSDEASRLFDEAMAALDREKLPPAIACRILSPVVGGAVMLGRDGGLQASRWLEAARAIGDAYETALALNILSVSTGMAGDPKAAAIAAEALAEARRSGSPSAISYCCFGLAGFLGDTEPAHAIQLLEESLRCAADAENDYATTVAIGIQSSVATKQGDHGTAARIRFRAAELAHRSGHLDHEAVQLHLLAGSLAVMDRSDPAAVLRGWADTIVSLPESAVLSNTARVVVDAFAGLPDRLGAERYASLVARGAVMSEHEALDFAAAHVPLSSTPAAVD
jgi:hypothetical protein